MRAALCLSGHLRTFEKTSSSLYDRIIKPFNCDVFIHCWDNLGCSTAKTGGDLQYKETKIDIGKVQDLYNPTSILVETEKSRSADFINKTNDIIIDKEYEKFIVRHIGYHICMFYSIYMANKLKNDHMKKNEIKYDLVIRCRPDIIFKSNIDAIFNESTLYIPKIATYAEDGINDQIAMGSNEIMNTYSNIYLDIIDYYKKKVCIPRPEVFFKYHLTKNNIKIKKIDIDYDILRLGGEIMRQYEMRSENINQ